MRVTTVLVLAAVLCGPVQAQERDWFAASAGATVTELQGTGLHLDLATRVPTPWDAVTLRADGMFEQTSTIRHLYAFGSVLLAPFDGPVSPYLSLGSGWFFDAGAQTAWTGGLGVDLGRSLGVPLFAEYRIIFGQTQRSALSLGITF